MAIQLTIFFVISAFIAGMFVGRRLAEYGSQVKHVVFSQLHRKVESIAMDLKTMHGLKNNYVVLATPIPGTKEINFVWLSVREFCTDHVVLVDGSIYSYQSFSGYRMPPDSVIQKMRAKESGLEIHSKVATN